MRDGQTNGHDRVGLQNGQTLTELIKEQPIAAVAIAAAAGYVFGGGVRRSTIIAAVVQIAVREALGNAVREALGNLVAETLGDTHDA